MYAVKADAIVMSEEKEHVIYHVPFGVAKSADEKWLTAAMVQINLYRRTDTLIYIDRRTHLFTKTDGC